MLSKPRIVVVGAGLTGAAAALGVAQAGIDVTVIEPTPPELNHGRLGVEIRHVALNPASQALLGELGAWPHSQVAAYRDMQVWEQWGTARVEFTAAEVGRDELGWLVEMNVLQVALYQSLLAHPKIQLVPERLQSIELLADTEKTHLRVQCDAGAAIESNLVIAADGGRSLVRQVLELPVVERPTDQVALATVVRTQQPHGQVARQRFLEEGPLALLPSADPHVSSVVWSQSKASGEVRQSLTESAFLEEMTFMSEGCLGDVLESDTRVLFPLKQQHFKLPPQSPGIVFVGDSMRVVHPLAGLGVNLGFEDVRALLENLHRGYAWQNPQAWLRYARQRHSRSVSVISLLEGFNRLYTLQNPGLGWLRNMGVKTFSTIPGLKQQVMREAMGTGAFKPATHVR